MKKLFSILIPLFLLTIANHCYGATYYVSTQGNDSNPGTSESQPWQTISKVNTTTFSPGDKILFKGGEIWNEQLNITSSGTASNPITYSSYGNGKPIFKGLPCGILIGNLPATLAVSNITISNLEITGSHWGIFAHGSRRNVEISNNYIHDLTASGAEEQQAVERYASSVTAIVFTHTQSDNSYIIIRDNLIENGLAYTGENADGTKTGNGGGINISTDSGAGRSLTGTSIYNNTINNIGGSGIALPQVRDIKIYSNRIYKPLQNSPVTNQGPRGAIQLGSASYIEVYDNDIEECTKGAGVYTFNANYSKFYNNKINKCSDGIHLDSGDVNYPDVTSIGNEIYNNVCSNNKMIGIMIEQENDNTKIWNNTLYNNLYANISFRGGNSYLTDDSITKNNILYSNPPAVNHLFEVPNLGFDNVFNNNLYYLSPITKGAFIEWPITIGSYATNGTHYSISQFSTYQSNSQQDANSIVSDPLFTDPVNNNFTPKANSPVCGAGDPTYGNDIGAIPCADSQTCQTGDIDCNGQVNSQDIQLAINILLGIETDPERIKRADIIDSNIIPIVINVQDIQKIINIVLGVN